MSNEEDFPAMTSHRPYLLRALYEWIADNGMTPHLLVDAEQPGVRVPLHSVKDGRVVLNVAERAVARLQMDNDSVRFSARFGGVSQPVDVPMAAVIAIYARETGQGMVLPEDVGGPQPGPEGVPPSSPDDGGNGNGGSDGPGPESTPPKRGHLRVVK
ncbi:MULTISPECIES: ClpXP protease specificity-enhancing factor [unclassified Luteimonas]